MWFELYVAPAVPAAACIFVTAHTATSVYHYFIASLILFLVYIALFTSMLCSMRTAWSVSPEAVHGTSNASAAAPAKQNEQQQKQAKQQQQQRARLAATASAAAIQMQDSCTARNCSSGDFRLGKVASLIKQITADTLPVVTLPVAATIRTSMSCSLT